MFLFKGFFNFLQMLKESHVVGKFMSTLCNAAQHIHHPAVDFPGIGLSGHRVTGIISHLVGYQLIQLFNLFIVSVKQFQKTGLGSRSTFGSQQFHRFQGVVQVFQIQQQIMDPQGPSFSDGSRLGRLEMGETESWQIFVTQGKILQLCHHVDQL